MTTLVLINLTDYKSMGCLWWEGNGESENSVQEINVLKNRVREIKYGLTRERGITHQTHKQICIMSIIYTVKKL